MVGLRGGGVAGDKVWAAAFLRRPWLPRATVSGTTRGYPRHPARWLIGRDVASVSLAPRCPGRLATATIGRIRAEGKEGREPAMKAILRYSACTVVAAAPLAQPRSGMASATGLERWLVSASAPSPVSAGALCLGINPGTMCGIRPGIISGPSRSTLRVVSGPAPCWVSTPAARVVSTPAECLVPARVVSAQRQDLVPAPAPCL